MIEKEMTLKDLPALYPNHFWAAAGGIYCHRWTGGQACGRNYGSPVPVRVTKLGSVHVVQFSNRELNTNVFQLTARVCTPDGDWPGSWFNVYLAPPATPEGEEYREW